MRIVNHFKTGIKVVVIYLLLMVIFVIILPLVFPRFQNCSSGPFVVCESIFYYFALLISIPGLIVFTFPVLAILNMPLYFFLSLNRLNMSSLGISGSIAVFILLPCVLIYFLISVSISVLMDVLRHKTKKGA
jgi:hypothetical protein